MIKRLAAILFIFICTSIAWAVLGGTVMMRTNDSESHLRGRVQSVWGVPQVQTAPVAIYTVSDVSEEIQEESGHKRVVQKHSSSVHEVPPSSSDIRAGLTLDHRRKGLLWYSTYKVDFAGDYTFQNKLPEQRAFRLTLKLPAEQAMYDDLQFSVDGVTMPATVTGNQAYVAVIMAPQQIVKLHAGYKSQGLDSWRYSFGEHVNTVENFHLRMTTNFDDIDFPENTLAPSDKRRIAALGPDAIPGQKGLPSEGLPNDGWLLDWNYRNLLSGYQIAMQMPAKLQPGPLASEISFFAPVSLFFFFFVIFIIATIRDIDLHPVNYFFLAAAFFAFHLLLAYLVDHVDINAAFLIASAVSVALVVSYLRIVVGTQFAWREAGIAQFLYLVLFSFAFFFKGYTGLAITIGAIVTLFVVMQMTGRIRWSEKFAAGIRNPSGPPALPFEAR
jgi:inner membrane protein involved in colicin E2 resistance